MALSRSGDACSIHWPGWISALLLERVAPPGPGLRLTIKVGHSRDGVLQERGHVETQIDFVGPDLQDLLVLLQLLDLAEHRSEFAGLRP